MGSSVLSQEFGVGLAAPPHGGERTEGVAAGCWQGARPRRSRRYGDGCRARAGAQVWDVDTQAAPAASQARKSAPTAHA
jgi:hypothetical protein